MIISNEYKFIWLFPIVHTASTSLFVSLRDFHDDEEFGVAPFNPEGSCESSLTRCPTGGRDMKFVNAHAQAKDLLSAGFDKEKFEEYLKIAVCRNPYTWMGSIMRKHGMWPPGLWSSATMKCTYNVDRLPEAPAYTDLLILQFDPSSLNVRRGPKPRNATIEFNASQVRALEGIDRVIKYEDLTKEYTQVLKEELGVKEDLELQRLVKPVDSPGFNYAQHYTKNAIKFVNETFSGDFEPLGYEKL